MLYEKEIKEDEKENKNMQNKIKRENQKTESMIINELNTVNNKTKEKNFLMAVSLINNNNLYKGILNTNNISEFSKLCNAQNKDNNFNNINNSEKKKIYTIENKLNKNTILSNKKVIKNIPNGIKEIIHINKRYIQEEINKNLENIININLKYKKENLIKTPKLYKIKTDSSLTEKQIILSNEKYLNETTTNINESNFTLNKFSKNNIYNNNLCYNTPTNSIHRKSFYLNNNNDECDNYNDKFYHHLSMKSYIFKEKMRKKQYSNFKSQIINNKKSLNNYYNKENTIIQSFQNENHQIFDLTFLENLIEKEIEYQNEININYIYKFNEINTKIRAQIFCLICSICENLGYKRDTYYLSTYNIDRYCSKISKKEKINKDKLILIALTSLEISAKIEEVQIVKLNEYIQILNELNEKEKKNSINLIDIISLEKKMMIEFKWKCNPNTLNLWLNWHIFQWDLFIETIEENYLKMKFAYDENIVFFRKKDNNSYFFYRQITQIVDLIYLDYENLSYDKQYLIIGAIFVILKNNYDKIRNNTYVSIFEDFVKQSLGEDILDDNLFSLTIKYVQKISKNFIQNNLFSYELPISYQLENDDINIYNFEDFVSYQIYNENLFDYSFKSLNNKDY